MCLNMFVWNHFPWEIKADSSRFVQEWGSRVAGVGAGGGEGED